MNEVKSSPQDYSMGQRNDAQESLPLSQVIDNDSMNRPQTSQQEPVAT